VNSTVNEEIKAAYISPNAIGRSFTSMELIVNCDNYDQCERHDSTKIICCYDWLAFTKLVQGGNNAVFYEFGLFQHDTEELDLDLYTVPLDFFKVDGVDQTLFEGVSLASLFLRDFSLISIAENRLRVSLVALIKIFNIKRLILRDLRAEFGVLSAAQRKALVMNVAEREHIEVLDAFQPISCGSSTLPQNLVYGAVSFEKKRLSSLRLIRGWVLARLSKLYCRKERNDISVVVTGDPIIKSLIGMRVAPERIALLSSMIGSRPKTLLRLIHRRFFLIDSDNIHESRSDDEKFISELQNKVRRLRRLRCDNLLCNAVIDHFLSIIDHRERLIAYINSILWWKRLFIQNKNITSILIDSVQAAHTRIPMYVANQVGVRVNYICHGVMNKVEKLDALSSSLSCGPRVDCVLSWGEHNEIWLRSIGYRGKVIRTGSPFIELYRDRANLGSHKEGPVESPIKIRKVLVLQYTPENSDIYAHNLNQYVYFTQLVSVLNKIQDVKEVVFKLHPHLFRKSYYEAIAAIKGLKVEVVSEGLFRDYVQNFDLVIGPANSGAYLEALMIGKHYIAVFFPPHCDRVWPTSENHFTSISKVVEYISKRDLGNHFVNIASLREEYTSCNSIDDPCNRILDALKGVEE